MSHSTDNIIETLKFDLKIAHEAIEQLDEENQFLSEELEKYIYLYMKEKQHTKRTEFRNYVGKNLNRPKGVNSCFGGGMFKGYGAIGDARKLNEPKWAIHGYGIIVAQKDENIQYCLEAMREQNKDKSIPQIIWKSYSPEIED